MAERIAAPGAPSFLEFGVPDARRARSFFEALFGWRFHDMPGDQFWIETPPLRAGVHKDDPDPSIVVYFAVDDIDAAGARVRELGGSAPEAGPEVEGFGRFTECRDDQGVRFGLRQPPR
jgi:predicted enzyme related to lactoylglutathione lyase